MMSVVTAIRSGQIPEDETKDHVLTSLVLPIARESWLSQCYDDVYASYSQTVLYIVHALYLQV